MAISKIGLGLAALGRPEYINLREEKEVDKSYDAFRKNAFDMLDEAYKQGVRYFDTAPSYGHGEQFLIDWNTDRNHADIALSTKWGYTYVANWELGFTGKHEIKEHSLAKLKEQWQQSQQLLPKLKIYQIHSATFESGVLQNQAVLQELHRIKSETGVQIGLSTSGTNQTEVIQAALQISIADKPLFDSFQVTYNVLAQEAFGVLKNVNKTIIIKEALANGRALKPDHALLNALAKKYQVGLDAIAMRFVIDSLSPTYVLSGAFNAAQLQQNLKVSGFSLTADELEELKSIAQPPQTYWQERGSLAWN